MAYCYNCMAELQEGQFCPMCGKSNAELQISERQILPGTILEQRYLLGRVLGAGAFGITYIGQDLRLNTKVAVKEYFPVSCANRNSTISNYVTISTSNAYFAGEGKAKFLQEAQVLAEFRNTAGVVNVYDYFEANGTAYIVMEFLEGRTLREVLGNRKFQPDELFRLMGPMMDALGEIHRKNLIHRDISPDNIMLTPKGKLVLMDFGAARPYDETGVQSATIMVKQGYAPPEQYRSQGNTGPWTDVYALCATMYHCLTGVKPPSSVERVIDDQLKRPSAYHVNMTPGQEAALMKGLACSEAERFQTVAALKKALWSSARGAQSVNGGARSYRGTAGGNGRVQSNPNLNRGAQPVNGGARSYRGTAGGNGRVQGNPNLNRAGQQNYRNPATNPQRAVRGTAGGQQTRNSSAGSSAQKRKNNRETELLTALVVGVIVLLTLCIGILIVTRL